MTSEDRDNAMRMALRHVEELEDAWARGLISEHDGGRRSSHNVEVRIALRNALDGRTVSVADLSLYEAGMRQGQAEERERARGMVAAAHHARAVLVAIRGDAARAACASLDAALTAFEAPVGTD